MGPSDINTYSSVDFSVYNMEVKVTKLQKKLLFIILPIMALTAIFFFAITTDKFDPRPQLSNPSKNSLYLDATQPIEARVADLLSYMTLEEKIGQMTLVEKDSIKEPSDIATYHLGALLSGSGSKPAENTPEGWKKMIDEYQGEAGRSRLGIPLLYGSDAVHGHAHVPGSTVFPHAISLGATNNPSLVEAVARATAEDLASTGVNWNFSPNLDLPQDIRWGRVYETFSDDPALVSKLGVAYLEGLQTSTSSESENLFVLATPKHFIGLGGMQWGSSLNSNFKIDQGVTPADEKNLRTVYLPPFTEIINAGALSIMAGLNTWGEDRTVRQKYLLTDVLKEELGFKGFVVSDWYGVHEGRKNLFLATVQALNAGVDMSMLPFDYKTFTRDVKWANRLGLVSDERINDAVGRILYAKFALGIFDKKEDDGVAGGFDLTHQALAREAVAESLVLLKNEGGVLPIKNSVKHIKVAGSAADNIGQQAGAWTVEWQGVDGNWLPRATSILAGIKERAGASVTVEYDKNGLFLEKFKRADLGIAVVGEKPYAEGWGDKAYPILSDEDLEAIKRLQETCDKVVVVLVSGRPLLVSNEIDSWDAVVMAWLPGSEGGGVADVLFGDKAFTGTLPLPWPLRSEQLPIAPDQTTADNTPVLFPRYFGLKY